MTFHPTSCPHPRPPREKSRNLFCWNFSHPQALHLQCQCACTTNLRTIKSLVNTCSKSGLITSLPQKVMTIWLLDTTLSQAVFIAIFSYWCSGCVRFQKCARVYNCYYILIIFSCAVLTDLQDRQSGTGLWLREHASNGMINSSMWLRTTARKQQDINVVHVQQSDMAMEELLTLNGTKTMPDHHKFYCLLGICMRRQPHTVNKHQLH